MQTYNLTIQDSALKLIATSLNNAIAYLPVSDGTNKTYKLTYFTAGNNDSYSLFDSYKSKL